MLCTEQILKDNNWQKTSLGTRPSNGKITKITGFDLYIRTTPLKAILGTFTQKSPNAPRANPHNIGVCGAGSSLTLGDPVSELTPDFEIERSDSRFSLSVGFDDFKSLVMLRRDKTCLTIAFDSEWQAPPETVGRSERDMLSWQFATVKGDTLLEFVFLRVGFVAISLDICLGVILDYLGYSAVDIRKVTKYQYCNEWVDGSPVISVTDNVNEAVNRAKYVYRDKAFTQELILSMPDYSRKRSDRDWAWFHKILDFSGVSKIPVTLVCHTGKVDITSLRETNTDYPLIRKLSEVQGGCVSMQPIRFTVKSFRNCNHHSYIYPVSLSIRDTMCHAPAGKKSLDALGKVVNIPKLELAQGQKSDMRGLLNRDPALFMEYASRDSVVTLLYASAVYGFNAEMPVTVNSAGASILRNLIMEYLNLNNKDEFNRKYRGLTTVNHGDVMLDDKSGFIENSSLEPVSLKAKLVQDFASNAYHGGYNSCSEVGYFGRDTFDYDLENAYPTAMCLVPDIDWDNPIRFEVVNQPMTLGMWSGVGGVNPFQAFVGYVRFEFPDNVKYPSIPINVEGIPIFPRTSEGLDGVYASGVEIFLALRLGASVFCERGFFLSTLIDNNTLNESRSLAYAVRQMVRDRTAAKSRFGKGCLLEELLKLLVNGNYGKVGQNVKQKYTWSAYKDCMEELGCSCVTNPVSACFITATVRALLVAAQNQAHGLGYMTCSVTTDGFISDMPFEVLKSLDLYGLRKYAETSRLFLTDNQSPELWAVKHKQNDLVNFTTRGNVSLLAGGVCAHNSSKSGFESDSFEDRLWLMKSVLERKGRVGYTDKEWSTFKELANGVPFTVKEVTRNISMDYDLKRKPDRSSFVTDRPTVNGETFEIEHFDTIPFDTVAEYQTYRAKKKLVDCLRTKQDWEIFWLKIDTKSCGALVRDLEWSVLYSCVIGHRAGFWSIPMLTVGSVEDKVAWLNGHNTSSKQFKVSDWKNARRPERQANMLPKSMLQDKLSELMKETV